MRPPMTEMPPSPSSSEIPLNLSAAWDSIAPFWPLKNLIAVNPLQGLEDLPFEKALEDGARLFQRPSLPPEMEGVNRESIKLLQVYFDEGQSTLMMPNREEGLYLSLFDLILLDSRLHHNKTKTLKWLRGLPKNAEEVIPILLETLEISEYYRETFLKLMLTTLPGWASYVQYKSNWNGNRSGVSVSQMDYVAFRLLITALMWGDGKDLIEWHEKGLVGPYSHGPQDTFNKIEGHESTYATKLLTKLKASPPSPSSSTPEAQFIFCIDVRSGPFRESLEKIGNYETFGFAGFFGLPIEIKNAQTGETYDSCPVLLSPKHTITAPSRRGCDTPDNFQNSKFYRLKSLYQSLKYTFTTPFVLVELSGSLAYFWMLLKSFVPQGASHLKSIGHRGSIPPLQESAVNAIPFQDQCSYAENALRMMGLTRNFAELIFLCGHGSTTQNNIYKTALDCGACGGRHGTTNARVLAYLLNKSEVRNYLANQGIKIPTTTFFMGAHHNTTTDQVQIYPQDLPENRPEEQIKKVKLSLEKAQKDALTHRKMFFTGKESPTSLIAKSLDWSEVRPEWGLAKNGAFIVGPRAQTKSVDLEGQAFLHSYDYKQDPDAGSLEVILTAPMVVAQWINTQYLFSTLDPVAYGSGNKVTLNVTGKIGAMQGNASDLMHGLPLQSVYSDDLTPYHIPRRLLTVVYAPPSHIQPIIDRQPILQKLFRNGWVRLLSIDPDTEAVQALSRNLKWEPYT